jgi:hypothetical protein
MLIKETFDNWYNQLTQTQKNEILGYILNTKCNLVCEGFHAGPIGLLAKGLFVAPTGSTAKFCPVCGK